LFLHERWGYPLVAAASLLAQAQLAATISRIPFGWVSDRWLNGKRKPLLHGIGAVGMGAVLALLLLST